MLVILIFLAGTIVQAEECNLLIGEIGLIQKDERSIARAISKLKKHVERLGRFIYRVEERADGKIPEKLPMTKRELNAIRQREKMHYLKDFEVIQFYTNEGNRVLDKLKERSEFLELKKFTLEGKSDDIRELQSKLENLRVSLVQRAGLTEETISKYNGYGKQILVPITPAIINSNLRSFQKSLKEKGYTAEVDLQTKTDFFTLALLGVAKNALFTFPDEMKAPVEAQYIEAKNKLEARLGIGPLSIFYESGEKSKETCCQGSCGDCKWNFTLREENKSRLEGDPKKKAVAEKPISLDPELPLYEAKQLLLEMTH